MVMIRKRKLSVFSRKALLLLLLLAPRQDPLYFSVQSGKSLLPDPGVKLSVSQPSKCGSLPGPEAILSMTSCQVLSDAFRGLVAQFILTLVLLTLLTMVLLKFLCSFNDKSDSIITV